MEIFANNIEDKSGLHVAVIKELRDYGIKYQKTRKRQNGHQDKNAPKRIFQTPLHQLELADVFLTNGILVQVPKFVSDSCQRILEQVTTEGLFRKAGSTARQKIIRSNLECGKNLDKSYHVVDVANLIKTFFRDLPEPLLPSGNVQESMLRCLLMGERKLEVLLMTCLLLPPLTLNILAFFMQFLETVSKHSDKNRMNIENLAIIFAPSLMPLQEMHPTRLTNHVKIIEMLIENAGRIGMVPQRFLSGNISSNETAEEQKKRKKRRSGSLTRVFNGLKKIVGVRGSADDLDKSLDITSGLAATPCLTKSTKKRKAGAESGMSAKKKKQIMALLPNGSLLPNTPMLVKENHSKKLRLSFGSSRRIPKFTGVEPPETITENHLELPQMERRWSVVGTPIKKPPPEEYFSPVVSMPCLNFSEPQKLPPPPLQQPDAEDEDDGDFVKISKSEYQALNERVAAIEARISLVETLPTDPAELVQDIYEQTLEETESINQPAAATDELAQRLGRDLKIRRSGERRIFRSPSARKIGTIRRRSRESAAKITRTKSWHVADIDRDLSFYPKASLKRGRPNTVQSGLRQPSPAAIKPAQEMTPPADDDDDDENELWTSAEEFFLTQPPPPPEEKIVFVTEKIKEILPEAKKEEERRQSPRFKTKIAVNDTPMLPPKGIPPRKTPGQRLKTPFDHHQQQQPPTGRASIARLRSQNAGMVAAKAKLFDGMTSDRRWPGCEENATPKRGSPRKFRRVLKAVNTGEVDEFLKPPPTINLVKVPPRLHSPNTPLKAFRMNSRGSPRVPRNYRSPRH